MWIFEWDIVDGSSSVLSAVYDVSKEDLEGAIGEGFQAVEAVRQMQALVQEIDPSTWRQPELYPKVVASLEYEANLLETLAWYRRAFLRYYQWLDTGDRAAFEDWRTAWTRFQEKRAEHLARYERDLDFPAYSFFSADAGMAHAVRGPVMAWLARLLLLVTALLLLLGADPILRLLPEFPGRNGLRALWAGWTDPGRLSGIPRFALMDYLVALGLPVLVLLLDHLTISSFLSPHYVWLMAVVMGVFAGVLLLLNRRTGAWRVGSALAASLMLWSAVPLTPVAVRGPLFIWYKFWTNATFRTALITANGLVGVWVLWEVYRTLRSVAGRSRLGALGHILVAIGGVLVAAGAVPALMGLEQAITRLNNEMAVLPLGLSLILGIVTHLDIPRALPLMMMATGAALALVGGLLTLPGALRRRS